MKKVNWIKVLKIALGIGVGIYTVMTTFYYFWAKAEIALATSLAVKQRYQLKLYHDCLESGDWASLSLFIQRDEEYLDKTYQKWLQH